MSRRWAALVLGSLLAWVVSCSSTGLSADDSPGSSADPANPDLVGTCAHDRCATGAKLASSCDPCVGRICVRDPHCCNTGWNAQCVSEVASVCATSCAGGRDAGGGSTFDLGAPGDDGDGAPTRQQCTNNFGGGLSATHGRLDGYLVSIVPPGKKGCNGDSSHVHLQILMKGSIYDVAVNVQDNNGGGVYYLAKDAPIPDGTWAEGWHTADGLSYSSLGLRASDFSQTPESTLVTTLENELASANHLSVFGTGYNASGTHLIHYQGGSRDGAIVIRPQSSTSRMLMFHFSDQSF
jgi:hypothetical protein